MTSSPGVRSPCGPRHARGPRRRTAPERKAHRGLSHRPHRHRLPAGGEPQHADARGWAAALREARGGRPGVHPRDVRGDARRRRDRTALPQAPAPLGAHRGPAGLEARPAVRRPPPRAAQRAAGPGPLPRAVRPVLAAALHPSGLGAPPVGGARDRGPRGRPRRALHQDPPRAGRRRLGDAAAAERAHHRPRPARHARAVGGRSAAQPLGPRGRGDRRCRRSRWPRCAARSR